MDNLVKIIMVLAGAVLVLAVGLAYERGHNNGYNEGWNDGLADLEYINDNSIEELKWH